MSPRQRRIRGKVLASVGELETADAQPAGAYERLLHEDSGSRGVSIGLVVRTAEAELSARRRERRTLGKIPQHGHCELELSLRRTEILFRRETELGADERVPVLGRRSIEPFPMLDANAYRAADRVRGERRTRDRQEKHDEEATCIAHCDIEALRQPPIYDKSHPQQ